VELILFFRQSIEAVFSNIATTNVATLIIGLVCTVFLYIIKDLNERFKKKLPIPIPGEIIVVKHFKGLFHKRLYSNMYSRSLCVNP